MVVNRKRQLPKGVKPPPAPPRAWQREPKLLPVVTGAPTMQQLNEQYKAAWAQAVRDIGGDPACREDYIKVPFSTVWQLLNGYSTAVRARYGLDNNAHPMSAAKTALAPSSTTEPAEADEAVVPIDTPEAAEGCCKRGHDKSVHWRVSESGFGWCQECRRITRAAWKARQDS